MTEDLKTVYKATQTSTTGLSYVSSYYTIILTVQLMLKILSNVQRWQNKENTPPVQVAAIYCSERQYKLLINLTYNREKSLVKEQWNVAQSKLQ